jgi:hypothetical protein
VIARRHLHLLIALLLPLMVMRGMLPTGYMAVTEAGKLRIVMCSAGLAAPGDSDSAPDRDNQRTQDSGGCLFAHAAGVAPPVQAGVVPAAPPARLQFSFAATSHLPPATGPPRLAAARAPPHLPV